MTSALRAAAGLGGFFAVVLDPDGPGWGPFPGAVDLRVDRLAARYPGPVDRRACASTDFLALVARVVSPAVATAARAGVVPVLSSDELRVHAGTGALGLPSTVRERPAAAFAESVLDTVCADLVAAYTQAFRLSEQVLWGNVASALAGAATVLGDGTAVVERALTSPHLADAGYYESPGRFRRRSCCLFYRLPGGGLCGDCVLAGG